MIDAFRLRHAIRIGLRSLLAHRLRSVLTTLGIVLGVASVIVMLAVGEAARREALRQLADLGANTILLKSVKPVDSQTRKDTEEILTYGLTHEDARTIHDTMPTVVSVTPMREFRKTVWHQDRKVEIRLASVVPEFFQQTNITILRGRGFEPLDDATYAKVAVISASVADQLFPGEDAINRTISIDGIGEQLSFTIVGISEDRVLSTGVSGDAAEYSKVLFIPFATDRVHIGQEIISIRSGNFSRERLELSQLTVTVDDIANVPRTANAIRSLIDEKHKQKDVQIQVPLELLRRAEETQRMFTLILAAIAGISLIVGGIGIMNIMLASVTERTREIGIRRALGAKRRDIARQFLIEALVLSSSGGLLGLALGISLAYALRNLLAIPTYVTLWSLGVAFAVALLTGVVSGLYPARRAARLNPIEALWHP